MFLKAPLTVTNISTKEHEMDEPTVSITKKDYVRLLKADAELNRLNLGGVDNWEWYGDSLNPDGEKDIDDVFEEIEKRVEAMK